MTSYIETRNEFKAWVRDLCVCAQPLTHCRSINVRQAIRYFLLLHPEQNSHRIELLIEFKDVWLLVDNEKWAKVVALNLLPAPMLATDIPALANCSAPLNFARN